MNPTYPELKDRVQSTLIDLVFIIFLMGLLSSLLSLFGESPDWLRAALFIGVWVIYDPLCTSLGCTLGNYIKHIRVRKVNDTTQKINIFQALFRYAFKLLLGLPSFITMHTNPQRRAIHDLIVGSVMIKI